MSNFISNWIIQSLKSRWCFHCNFLIWRRSKCRFELWDNGWRIVASIFFQVCFTFFCNIFITEKFFGKISWFSLLWIWEHILLNGEICLSFDAVWSWWILFINLRWLRSWYSICLYWWSSIFIYYCLWLCSCWCSCWCNF